MLMRSLSFVIYLALIIAAGAAEGPADARRGGALVTRDCARCHAVGRTGPSTHPEAPPFRTLGKRYPIESLEEALGEGIISGHPDMPEFRFESEDVGAIIAYLKSIQER
jgi:cytochrome c